MENKNVNEQQKEPPGIAIYVGRSKTGRKKHVKEVLKNFDVLMDFYIPKISERIAKAKKKYSEGDINGTDIELQLAKKELVDLSTLITITKDDIDVNYGNYIYKESQ
jgi:hypothetical protein